PDRAAPAAGIRAHVPGAVLRLGAQRSRHCDDDGRRGHHARPGEYAARLRQGRSRRAGAAAPRQSLLHAAGLGLVPARGTVLAAAVPHCPRPGVPQCGPRARRADRAARQGAPGEPRSQGREEGRVITLWELGGKDGRRYSLFSWRTRMALRHKGLDFETVPVLMSDKAAIAFSGGKTVPVIKDGETVVRDSWKIAEHLEDRYAKAPTLFGGAVGRGVTQAFNVWVDRAVVPAMLAVIVADVHERIDSADQAYFRASMEKFLKTTLEEARARRDQAMQRFNGTLEPMEALMKRQPWISGAQPAYADYILFSVFQWARVMSPDAVVEPPLRDWSERVLDLHDCFARSARL